MTRYSILLAVFLVLPTFHRAEAIEKADLVLLDGSIVTVDSTFFPEQRMTREQALSHFALADGSVKFTEK